MATTETIKSLCEGRSTLQQMEIHRRADSLFPTNPVVASTTSCPFHYWWRGAFYGGILTDEQVLTLTVGLK